MIPRRAVEQCGQHEQRELHCRAGAVVQQMSVVMVSPAPAELAERWQELSQGEEKSLGHARDP